MIANKASISQVHYFFAIATKLGFTAMETKDRAKQKYALQSFSEITSNQLSILIDALKARAIEKGINLDEYRHTHAYVCECGHTLQEKI